MCLLVGLLNASAWVLFLALAHWLVVSNPGVQVKSVWPRCPTCKTLVDVSTQRDLVPNLSAASAGQTRRRMTLMKLEPLPSATPRSNMPALGSPLIVPPGVQLTEITYCSNCKAPMKTTWERCPGCKTPATAPPAPMISAPLPKLQPVSPQVPGAMESPRGASETAAEGEVKAGQAAVDSSGLLASIPVEELARQRQQLGFSLLCATCHAPVKPAWPRCPSCRTPLPKSGSE